MSPALINKSRQLKVGLDATWIVRLCDLDKFNGTQNSYKPVKVFFRIYPLTSVELISDPKSEKQLAEFSGLIAASCLLNGKKSDQVLNYFIIIARIC